MRPSRVWACSAAVLLAGLIYANALHNPFVYDDKRVIVENRALQGPLDIRAIVLHDMTRPVVSVSYALDRAWWGPEPFGFHVTNVVLHMVNVGLMFLLAFRLAEDWGERSAQTPRPLVVASCAAALLAVHPMMTEAVGYISGRSEVLCATFFLTAFLAARRWMRTGRWMWAAASLLLWVVALATKEIAAMLPFVLFSYDRLVCPGTGADRRSRLRRVHLPMLACAALAAIARLAVFAFVEQSSRVHVQWHYAFVELDVIRQYLFLLVVPSGQTIFHAVAPITSVLDLRVVAAVVVLGAMLGVAWRAARTEAIVSFGLMWFFLLLLPSSALVMLDRGEPMAEHRVYLAACGMFLAAGAAVSWLVGRVSRASPAFRLAVHGALVVGLVSLGAHTVARNRVWSDPVQIWAEAADQAPVHWAPQLLLGEALHDAKRNDDAIAAFSRAIRLRPEEPDGYRNLGVCYVEAGRLADATSMFEKLEALVPRSVEASNGLGTVALVAGRLDDARGRFLRTLEYDPMNVPARIGLVAIDETSNPAEALRRCREITQIAPGTRSSDECIAKVRAAAGSGGS